MIMLRWKLKEHNVVLKLWLEEKDLHWPILEIKKKKNEFRLSSTSYRMQCCSCVFPQHLWPFCGSQPGWGETTGPIYCQAQGRENTISWQKTSHPEQTLISTQTYTTSHLRGLGLLSVYLCSARDTSSPSALIYRVCMQGVVMHVITLRGVFICLWFALPQEGGSLLPSEWQCVFRGRTCIFKNSTLSTLLSCSFPAD